MDSNRHSHAMLFLFGVILIDVIGFGIIIPVLPKLIQELAGVGVSEAARYGGWLLFLYAFMQFLCAPILGNLSDRYGRRPVLLASMSIFAIDYLLMGFAPTLAWLFVGRFLAGIVGATFSAANAYIADISAPENRAKNFGMVGAAFGLGFILGPVLGGLLGSYSLRLPFFASAALAFANAIYGYFLLPESLKPEERRGFSWKRANPIGALLQMKQFPIAFGLLGVIVFYQIAHDANPSVWTYYTFEKFRWGEAMVGLSLGFLGLMITIVQAGLIRVAIDRFGELRTAYLGFFFFAVGYFGFAFATEGWMVFVCIVPLALGGLAMPAVKGIMANQVPNNAQGELQGAITSLNSLTAILTPLLMTQLFGFFTSPKAPVYFPGAPFLLAGCLLGLASLVFFSVMRSFPR